MGPPGIMQPKFGEFELLKWRATILRQLYPTAFTIAINFPKNTKVVELAFEGDANVWAFPPPEGGMVTRGQDLLTVCDRKRRTESTSSSNPCKRTRVDET